MMQQLTGVNFIFYFGTSFLYVHIQNPIKIVRETDKTSQTLGTISNPFLISLITTLVNVCSTPISFYTIEKFGRRPLLIYGASES
jgi:ABC-type sulfate transport system permease component